MSNYHKDSLYSVFFGIVILLASVLFVITGPLIVLASGAYSELDLEEAVEAGDVTMANQTVGGVEFLFIQNAQSGSISQINETAYTLELNNVANNTILFSDRPERIVETVSTSDFIGNWTTGPNSFESDAPNDALIVENTETGELESVVIESFNPMYDANTNTLRYTVMRDNNTSINLPNEFGQTVIVIDDINHPPIKNSRN